MAPKFGVLGALLDFGSSMMGVGNEDEHEEHEEHDDHENHDDHDQNNVNVSVNVIVPTAPAPTPAPPLSATTPVASETSQAQPITITVHDSSTQASSNPGPVTITVKASSTAQEQVTVTEQASSTQGPVTITQQASQNEVQSTDSPADEAIPSATMTDSNDLPVEETDPASNDQPGDPQDTSANDLSVEEPTTNQITLRRATRCRRYHYSLPLLSPRLLISTLGTFSTMTSFVTLPSHVVRPVGASHISSGTVQARWDYPAASSVTSISGVPDAVSLVPLHTSGILTARDCDGPCSEGVQGISTSVSVASDPLAARDTVLVALVPTTPVFSPVKPTTFLTRVKRGRNKPNKPTATKTTTKKTTKPTTTKKPVATTTSKKPVAATTTKKPVATTTSKKPVAATTTKAAQQTFSSSSTSSSHDLLRFSSKVAQLLSDKTASAIPISSGTNPTGDALGDVGIANNDEDNTVGAPMPDDTTPEQPSKPGNSTVEAGGADAPPAESPSAVDGQGGSTGPGNSTSSE